VGSEIEFIYDDVGILRGGDNFQSYGDFFDYSATVIIKNNTLYVKGFTGTVNAATRQDIRDLLLKHGLHGISWERFKNNKKLIVERLA
jgi:hypothetical protein